MARTTVWENASAGCSMSLPVPTEEFESFIDTTLTDDNELKVSGVVSGPLTQALGFRVAATRITMAGRRTIHGEDINGSEEHGGG